MNTLRVYVDFKSPGAYLALNPTIDLAQRCGVDIEWRPIKTRQQPIPEQTENEDRGTTHRRVRAVARRDMHLFYANVQGIHMQFPTDNYPDTDLALAALAKLSEPRTGFVEAAFAAYWHGSADLNDVQTVQSLLDKIGDQAIDLYSLDVETIIQNSHEQAVDDGVIEAPGYAIADQVFVGREHLPWIEALLTDNQAHTK